MLNYQIIPVTAFEQNCSLLWCDQTLEAVFIDPGGDVHKLQAALAARNLTLTDIWLTHGHLDHAGGAQDLRAMHGIQVIGPAKEDDFWLEGIEQQAAAYGLSGLKSVLPDQWLSNKQVVTVGQERLEVIVTPGHTPGHVVFYHEEQQLAWVGDVLFAGSIGRTDFPKGNHADLIHSITQYLWPLGNGVRFIPGHGPESTFGKERQSNPYVADTCFK